MTKKEQVRLFENDLIALCKRYLSEFDIDAAIIFYVFTRTISEVFGDMLEDEFDDE